MSLVKNIFSFLNTNCNYAVLRNYSDLPENPNSRDIDILIARNDFSINSKRIISIIQEESFNIITYFKSDRMVTFVCGSISEQGDEIIQFDFFFQTSIYGVIIIDADQMLKVRVFNGKIYHVTEMYEFLDKYLYLKFLNKSYPEKYQALKTEMEQSTFSGDLLKKIVGCCSVQELEKLSSVALKKRILYANIRKRPLEQMFSFSFFLLSYLKNFFSYKGYSISFTGADGSGKTTIIEAILAVLRKTYTAVELFHFRPSIIPNLGEVAYKIKLKSDVDRNYSQPHRGGKTGNLNSFTRLLFYSVDYILGYFIRVRPLLHKRNVVIFDRYFTDIIADSRRSRIFLNHKFLYWFGKLFIPKLDYNILLTANRDVIFSRKQELGVDGIGQINEKLDYLSHKQGYNLVSNNGSPEAAVRKILKIVFEEQNRKNLKIIMQ